MNEQRGFPSKNYFLQNIPSNFFLSWIWSTQANDWNNPKCHFTRLFLVFGLLCRHAASNSITSETHTSGAQ